MRRWVIVGAVALVCVVWVVEAQAYRGPFKGRVVDAETLQPIQGAVVFVEWSRGVITLVEAQSEYYDAAEVLTDEKWYFHIKKKWSLNPWTIFATDASVIIFKAGYGRVDISHWPRLKEVADYMRGRSLEERKRVGPEFYFDIEFEDGLPVFLLKKLTTVEERIKNLPHSSGDAPEQKMRFLQEEKDKERKALGLN